MKLIIGTAIFLLIGILGAVGHYASIGRSPLTMLNTDTVSFCVAMLLVASFANLLPKCVEVRLDGGRPFRLPVQVLFIGGMWLIATLLK